MRRDPEALWQEAQPVGRQRMGLAPNEGYRPPKLDAMVADEWQGRPIPERQWIIPQWIPRRAVTMLGGDGGGGKSLLAQMLLTSAAVGSSWLGLDVAPVKALGIFCEDDIDELQRRQADINRMMGIDFADLDNLHLVSAVGEDDSLVSYTTTETGGRGLLEPTDFYRSIHTYVNEHGIQLVVLDSLHDLFPGNENSRPEVRRFVQFLIAMALDIDGAVILTAHPSLSGLTSGSGLSGSTAWNNAVRSRLYLSRPDAGDGAEPVDDERILARLKANYARATDRISIHWQDGAFVANGDQGGFIGGLDRAAQQRSCQEAFLALLARFTRDGRPVSDKNRAGNYAPKMFAKRSDREGFTKRDFETAMERLFEAGRIAIETYGRKSDERQQIVIKEGGKS